MPNIADGSANVERCGHCGCIIGHDQLCPKVFADGLAALLIWNRGYNDGRAKKDHGYYPATSDQHLYDTGRKVGEIDLDKDQKHSS